MDDLYFFRSDNGRVKIGRSVNVKARLNAVRCSSPVGVMLWAVLEGHGWEECAWHAVFRDHRINGEWFKWNAAISRAVRLAQNRKEWWRPNIAADDTEGDVTFRRMLEYMRSADAQAA